MLMSIFNLIYLFNVKPFVEISDNYVEIFEELTVLGVASILPLFTDMLDDSDTRWDLGWLIVAVLFFNLFINTIIILVNMWRTL